MATRAASLPHASASSPPSRAASADLPAVDWRRVAYLFQASRALDDIEEHRLVPQRKVLYQFSARGHELGQILMGLRLTARHDGAGVYYRSRPLMLAGQAQAHQNLYALEHNRRSASGTRRGSDVDWKASGLFAGAKNEAGIH